MIARFVSLVALAWALGFAVFMVTLPEPNTDVRVDAVVVPTGAAGRIDRGLALIEEGRARRMLVTGVASTTRKRDLVQTYGHAHTFACCVDLGRDAVDTRSNAEETVQWVRRHGYRSLALVTSDWHMARARMELAATLGDDVAIVADGVPSEQRLGLLVNEYNKLILRRLALWTGWGR